MTEMTERERCEKVAAAWVHCNPGDGEEPYDPVDHLADLIERERADARTQELERVSARHADAQDMVLRQTNISQAWQEGTYRERERGLRAKLERAEAAAAQMRAALQNALVGGVLSAETCKRLLATNVGASYTSPEQHARAVAEARRQALEEACMAVCARCRDGAVADAHGFHDDGVGALGLPRVSGCPAKAIRALVKP